MSKQLPALSRATFQPDVYGQFEEQILGRLVLGHSRDDFVDILNDATDTGEIGEILPDIPNPTRRDLDELVDSIIREYQRLVPEKSVDAVKIEQIHSRLEERGIAVIFGEPAWDRGEGHDYGRQRARSLPNAIGYSFTHAQDLCTLAVDGAMAVGFWGLDDQDQDAALAIGRAVEDEYRNAGFDTSWNEKTTGRIVVSGVCWEVPTVAQPLPPDAPGSEKAPQPEPAPSPEPAPRPKTQDAQPSDRASRGGFFGRLFGRR